MTTRDLKCEACPNCGRPINVFDGPDYEGVGSLCICSEENLRARITHDTALLARKEAEIETLKALLKQADVAIVMCYGSAFFEEKIGDYYRYPAVRIAVERYEVMRKAALRASEEVKE